MVCPLDGQPVGKMIRSKKSVPATPAARRTSFDVKLNSPVSAAGTYRVFLERSDLIFIQLESGSRSIWAALAPVLGPAGGLVPLVLWLFTRKRAKARLPNLESPKPEILLRENPENFKLYLAEIREAAFEPATWLATSGKAGRLMLTVRHGEILKFEFANAAEMTGAIQLLSPLLNSTLKIGVEWHEAKHQYQKKKTG